MLLPGCTELGAEFTGRHGWEQLAFLMVSAPCKVSGVFRHIRVSCGPDFHVSANTNRSDLNQLIDLGHPLGCLGFNGKDVLLAHG